MDGGDLNMYLYAGASPLNWFDPWGLEFISPEEGQSLVDEASTWLGTPYLSPGSTKKGADCVGSAWAIYAKKGFPYTNKKAGEYPTIPQFKEVPSPQSGDIVQWSGHVAVYAGEGYVWSTRREGKTYGYYPAQWFSNTYGPPRYLRYWK
jgi:cell wall-associated NlpC family hydrolase